MNVDLLESGTEQKPVFFLFWISFFLFFYPLVFPSSLSLPSAVSSWPSAPLRVSGFSTGDRMAYSSFQDTDILSCFCFPAYTLMFSNSGYVSCWKTGPHKSFWQPQTDLVENHLFLGRQSEESHSVCARAACSHSLSELDCSQSHYPHSSISLEWRRPSSLMVM